MASAFTVFFDGSLWMGVLEVTDDSGVVRAARHVFGAEPSDAELWEFIATYANSLFDRAFAAPAVEASERRPRAAARNPKRLARQAAREQRRLPASTASQRALALAREKRASERIVRRRADKDARARIRREARIAKRKAKHRGR